MAKKKKSWSVLLNMAENDKYLPLVAFLNDNGYIGADSKYRCIRYLLELGNDVLRRDRIVEMSNLLYKEGVIPSNDLIDSFKFLILMGIDTAEKQIEGD